MIVHEPVEGIICEVGRGEFDLVIIRGVSKCQISSHPEEPCVDSSSVVYFTIVFAGLHWFSSSHGSSSSKCLLFVRGSSTDLLSGVLGRDSVSESEVSSVDIGGCRNWFSADAASLRQVELGN